MTELVLSVAEPFLSPAWGSNFVAFTSERPIPEERVRAYIGKACKYARHYGVYVVPERFILLGYHCLCLISPQGKVLGAQRALYRNLADAPQKHGTDLEVFDTEFGGISLCVDVDVYHPEVCRLTAIMGARIIICAQQIAPEAYGSHMVISGVWNASQLNNCFVVGITNRFNCCCIPVALSRHGNGFLIEPNAKLPMTVRLQAQNLEHLPVAPVLNRKFYAVHRHELLK